MSGDGSQLVYVDQAFTGSSTVQGVRTLTAVAVPGATPSARIVADEVFAVVVASTYAMPADASAAMLDVTVTNPGAAGFLTVWPCRQPRPLASNVNFAAGQTIANAVLVTIGADGQVCAASNVAVDVVVDAQGWFGPASPYDALSPRRLLDTRQRNSGTMPNVVGGATVTIAAPAGATAVMLNVTATNPVADGYLTVWPCGQPRPLSSNLNYGRGETIANAVLAGVGTDGNVCLASNVATDIVIDLEGTFGVGSPYHPLTPIRLVDTRN